MGLHWTDWNFKFVVFDSILEKLKKNHYFFKYFSDTFSFYFLWLHTSIHSALCCGPTGPSVSVVLFFILCLSYSIGSLWRSYIYIFLDIVLFKFKNSHVILFYIYLFSVNFLFLFIMNKFFFISPVIVTAGLESLLDISNT